MRVVYSVCFFGFLQLRYLYVYLEVNATETTHLLAFISGQRNETGGIPRNTLYVSSKLGSQKKRRKRERENLSASIYYEASSSSSVRGVEWSLESTIKQDFFPVLGIKKGPVQT